jgi:hypothetical protein
MLSLGLQMLLQFSSLPLKIIADFLSRFKPKSFPNEAAQPTLKRPSPRSSLRKNNH